MRISQPDQNLRWASLAFCAVALFCAALVAFALLAPTAQDQDSRSLPSGVSRLR